MNPCDTEVYAKGVGVLVLGSAPSSAVVDAWVDRVREEVQLELPAAKVDWHLFCGRDVVRCLPTDPHTISVVVKAIQKLLPDLAKAYEAEQVAKGRTGHDVYELGWYWPDDALAIVDPAALAKKERAREEQRRQDDQTIEGYTARTEYLVEADGFAKQELWARWHDRYKVPWKDFGMGTSREIGRIDKRPVCVTVFWSQIGREKVVGFWHATSQVVDYVMIEEWLKKEFPRVGARCTADAMNFHNIMHSIQDATGEQLMPEGERGWHCQTCRCR